MVWKCDVKETTAVSGNEVKLNKVTFYCFPERFLSIWVVIESFWPFQVVKFVRFHHNGRNYSSDQWIKQWKEDYCWGGWMTIVLETDLLKNTVNKKNMKLAEL